MSNDPWACIDPLRWKGKRDVAVADNLALSEHSQLVGGITLIIIYIWKSQISPQERNNVYICMCTIFAVDGMLVLSSASQWHEENKRVAVGAMFCGPAMDVQNQCVSETRGSLVGTQDMYHINDGPQCSENMSSLGLAATLCFDGMVCINMDGLRP